MAHEIRSTDRFGEVRANGKRAWHGLGVEIPEGIDCTTAFPMIGLDWATELLPVRAERLGWQCNCCDKFLPTSDCPTCGDQSTSPVSSGINLPEHRAHIRSDTGQVLGLVSDGYKPIDNRDLATFADAVLGEDRAATCETAGSLFDGRKVFALIRLPGDLVAAAGDSLARYIAITNGHGGTAAFAAYPTTVRIVCNNTLRMSEQSLSQGARFVHTGDLKGKLATARLVLGFANRELLKLDEQIRAMVNQRPGSAAIASFLDRAFRATFAAPSADDVEATEKWESKRRETQHRWADIYKLECDRTPAIAGSVWAAFNAVTEWHDHERGRFEDVATSDARVHSNLFGVSHVAKSKTLKLALSLV